jgi:hypothetical protein
LACIFWRHTRALFHKLILAFAKKEVILIHVLQMTPKLFVHRSQAHWPVFLNQLTFSFLKDGCCVSFHPSRCWWFCLKRLIENHLIILVRPSLILHIPSELVDEFHLNLVILMGCDW